MGEGASAQLTTPARPLLRDVFPLVNPGTAEDGRGRTSRCSRTSPSRSEGGTPAANRAKPRIDVQPQIGVAGWWEGWRQYEDKQTS